MPMALISISIIRPGDISDGGVFAEFERSMIQERIRAGRERTREQEKALNRSKYRTGGRLKYHLHYSLGAPNQASRPCSPVKQGIREDELY